MKTLGALFPLLAISLGAPFVALAAPDPEQVKSVLEAQPKCGNFVRFDDRNLYLGFGWYRNGVEEPRHPIPARMSVAPLSGGAAFDLATDDAAIDFASDGTTGYVLTYSALEEWDLLARKRLAKYPTYAINGPLAYMEHAQGLARYKKELIIAHGRLGVSFFNLRTKRLSNQFRLVPGQLPLESVATGVTVQGHYAYVVMDNFSLVPEGGRQAFRGILKIDLDRQAVVSELDGMDPGADAIVSDGKNTIVSFSGRPIWMYETATLTGSKIPEPTIRVWRYPVDGTPIGFPAVDDKYYYTCYQKAPAYRGQNGGYSTKLPLALNRAELMLK